MPVLPRLPHVEGLFQSVPVAFVSAHLSAGHGGTITLEADAMDSVHVIGNPRIQQVRYVPATQDADVGWQPPTRLCLPLTSPSYPCHRGNADPAADWQAARQRIPDDNDIVATYLGVQPAPHDDSLWTNLYQAMASVFGPPIPASFHMTPLHLDQSTLAISPVVAISPVDVMLLASVDPYVARVLGLAWVDPTALPGQAYDYRVVGNWDKGQLKAPEATVGFDLDAAGRVLPQTFVRDDLRLIFRSANRGTIADVEGAPWNDTLRGLDLGAYTIANQPGQPAYLRLQLDEAVGEVQLYLRVFSGQPALATSVAPIVSSRWSSGDGAFLILTVAARNKTDRIDNITLQPAANSGGLHVAVCKVGLLPGWSPPMSEPLEWITYNVIPAPHEALPAPTGLFAVSIPTPARELDDQTVASGPRAGLRWTMPLASDVLLPRQAVRYVIQRQSLGNGAVANAIDDLAWKSINVPASLPEVPATVSGLEGDIPYFYLDDPAVALGKTEADRFYAYRVAGVDLFGRLGAYSAPFKADLVDTYAPPAPINVEAKYLDPADPALTPEELDWVNGDQPPRSGVKLSWAWSDDMRRQAPDAREFRVYVQPGRLNAIVGSVTTVTPNADGSFTMATDQSIRDDAADAFVGESLQSGDVHFTVLHNTAGANFSLIVRPPSAPPPALPVVGAFTLAIGPERRLAGAVVSATPHLNGTVTLTTDRPTALAANALAGRRLKQAGQSFLIVASTAGPTLRLTVVGAGGIPPRAPRTGAFEVMEQKIVEGRAVWLPSAATPANPLYVDYRLPDAWAERIHVAPVTTAVNYAAIVKYPLVAKPGEPVAYAQIAVSTADDKDYVADSARWNGTLLGGHSGNEGMVSAPVLLQKTLRQTPPRPDAPDVGDGLATAADYYGASTIAVGWAVPAGMRVHVYRALDEAMFAADRAARAARSTNRAEYSWLSDDAFTALVAQSPDYAALSDDLLQALARLPGNDAAFGLMTTAPLSSAPYRAALEGRSTNRYCFAVKLVDAAGNPSALSWPSRAVRAPKVRPPATPVITKVVGGDRQITVTWAANREPDLKEYRLYRAESEEAAHDLRVMALVRTEAVPPDDVETRPATVTWPDTNLPGLVTFYYRLLAVDNAGNVSASAAPVSTHAYDQRTLDPPGWVSAGWNASGSAIDLRWVSSDPNQETVVLRRHFGAWRAVSSWLPAGTADFTDATAKSAVENRYALRARNAAGNVNVSLVEIVIGPRI